MFLGRIRISRRGEPVQQIALMLTLIWCVVVALNSEADSKSNQFVKKIEAQTTERIVCLSVVVTDWQQ